jgi:hypothetical protein
MDITYRVTVSLTTMTILGVSYQKEVVQKGWFTLLGVKTTEMKCVPILGDSYLFLVWRIPRNRESFLTVYRLQPAAFTRYEKHQKITAAGSPT